MNTTIISSSSSICFALLWVSVGPQTSLPTLDRGSQETMWLAQYRGPCLGVCVSVFVLTWEIGMVAGGHGAHTQPFCLHELTPHTYAHISKTHTNCVTPHPAKPALTVLSHHIWAVLTGDATGQSTATCMWLLQPLCPWATVSPLPAFVSSLCILLTAFSPTYHVQIW